MLLNAKAYIARRRTDLDYKTSPVTPFFLIKVSGDINK